MINTFNDTIWSEPVWTHSATFSVVIKGAAAGFLLVVNMAKAAFYFILFYFKQLCRFVGHTAWETE